MMYGGVGILGTLIYLGLAAGLVMVGLTHVRKVHAMSGYCLAGAGAIEGFQAIVGFFSSFLYGVLGSGIFTVTSLLALLTGLASGALILGAIFLLANEMKQAPAAAQQNMQFPGYGAPPGYGPGPGFGGPGGPGYGGGPPPGYGPGPGPGGAPGGGGPGYGGPPPGYGPGPGPGPGY